MQDENENKGTMPADENTADTGTENQAEGAATEEKKDAPEQAEM